MSSYAVRRRVRGLTVGLVVAALAFAATVSAVTTGDLPIPAADALRAIVGVGDERTELIVREFRLPRVLTGLLVGAALGVSGAVFQSITRNPLGSPDVVGFDNGAATGGLLAILLLSAGTVGVAAGAVAGGLLTAAVVYVLAWRGGASGYRLVLVGIGVSAALVSVNSYLITRADIGEALTAQVWLTGSLNGRGWEHVRPVLVALLVLIPLVLLASRRLAVLEMGDDAAAALGVPVERTRLALLVLAVLLAAVATASAGPIRFVALSAPQIARRLSRSAQPALLVSALLGALMVGAGDLVGQRLLAPRQLPVGVVTGVLGGAYLAWLLTRERRRRSS